MFRNQNFGLIFSSYYKGNVVYAKDCWQSKNYDWWRSERFCDDKLWWVLEICKRSIHSELGEGKNL